jgi:kynurenine formamidase
MAIDEHTGTHFDAPSHFIPPADTRLPNAGELGELSTDRVPIDQLVGPAAVIDVSDLSEGGRDGESPHVTRERILRWEAEHGELRPGDVVLLRGDWDRFYLEGSDGDSYSRGPMLLGEGQGWPSPDAEAVIHLDERGVRCLGTDGASIGGADEGESAHVAGLARGMVYVEALCDLKRLPPRGAFFVFLPIKVRDGTGGPGRAIALLPG